MRLRPTRPWRAPLAALVLIGLSGCGYTVRPPYNRTVKTVYVPMFKSNRFRRDLNLQFTELLQAEIRNRTPYLVVASPEGADATLSGTITLDDKNLVLENPNNLPRQLQTMMFCVVTYTDNRTGASTTKKTLPALVVEMSLFEPEVGETTMLAFQKTMKKLAQDVVGMMEDPWGDEYREDPDIPAVDPTDVSDAPRAKTPRRR